jgi:hypothetical protein
MIAKLLRVVGIGRLLGVGRQRVQQLVSPGFPALQAGLAMGKDWLKDDVIVWARAHGRLASD